MSVSQDHHDDFGPANHCLVCGVEVPAWSVVCTDACADELLASSSEVIEGAARFALSDWVADPTPTLPRPTLLTRLFSALRPHRQHAEFLDDMEVRHGRHQAH